MVRIARNNHQKSKDGSEEFTCTHKLLFVKLLDFLSRVVSLEVPDVLGELVVKCLENSLEQRVSFSNQAVEHR